MSAAETFEQVSNGLAGIAMMLWFGFLLTVVYLLLSRYGPGLASLMPGKYGRRRRVEDQFLKLRGPHYGRDDPRYRVRVLRWFYDKRGGVRK